MSHADSPKVQSARQKADAGYYDRPEVIDAALDRLAADLDAMPHAVVDAADLADIIGDEMEGILQTRPFTDEWGGEDNVFRSCVREVGVELPDVIPLTKLTGDGIADTEGRAINWRVVGGQLRCDVIVEGGAP